MDSLFSALRDLAFTSSRSGGGGSTTSAGFGGGVRGSGTADAVRDLLNKYESKVSQDRRDRDALKNDVYSAIQEAERSANQVKTQLDEIKKSLKQKVGGAAETAGTY
jgi:outer membrane murein-binding lipoprotein Lpp